MKAQWIVIPASALILMSAGLALTSEPRVTKALAAQTNQALAPDALAKKSGCLECHSVDKKVVGPSYRDIAEKYKSDPAARSALIEKVKKGGKGNWTAITNEVPMPPYGRRLSETDITRLVDWVLSLKDSETK
jgi:cytochrome c